ncbi:excalibur calcium-binding domain-containing protein [Promicromonospora citrea]|uniref:Excalibur calcium-binding domain-containing protein n=1 Tax=Promicromonospora citrea TaxID=43677 RepID=A0A8H9GF82_9MICO|nr:excalibur calcium-binding domain-containing protein [Promicromonospora citrea]NNH52007.1 excalibur calcium-binding domain-containing protein [Promicromonospora citrea]GGM17204.1 hypothetical protein GCM10010102_11020 [Promicromonospora citrea]
MNQPMTRPLTRSTVRRGVVALVSALALLLSAAPAQAATVYPTSVTTKAASDTVKRTSTVTLKGTLKYKKGGKWQVLSGRTLTVYFDPAGPVKKRKVKVLKTGTAGSYTYKAKALNSGTWTVTFGGAKGKLRSANARESVCVWTSGRWQCPVTPDNPDLDCKDIRKTVRITGKDYHRLDGDHDGWGCE